MALKEQLKERRLFSIHDFNASKVGSTDPKRVTRHRKLTTPTSKEANRERDQEQGMLYTPSLQLQFLLLAHAENC